MGEFLLILDQSSNGLDPEVIDYPNTYVAMNHSDRFGVSISKLGLPMEQGSIISSLEKYTAIVGRILCFVIIYYHFRRNFLYSEWWNWES